MTKKAFKNIFLSSIHENAGKTTICLGLYAVLKERRYRMAFMKPVGQKVVSVKDYAIDKDSYLIGEVYQKGRNLKAMSPITIGRGFTEEYISKPHKDKLQQKIEKSFQTLIKRKNAIIVEGTGHAGVGSVIDFSNADTAQLLGSKVIIVSEGGIGKCIDEVNLNMGLFKLNNVEILGVIVNKVRPEKYNKIKRTLARGFKNKGIKLLGVIPVDPLLSSPTVEQVKTRLGLDLMCGRENMSNRVKNTIVAAMEPHNMIQYLKGSSLVLTSGDRYDNILAAVSSHLVNDTKEAKISGIILTGGLMPNPKIVELLRQSKIPVLISSDDTYTIAARIENLIPKIQKTDKDKIQEARMLVKKYVDIDGILSQF